MEGILQRLERQAPGLLQLLSEQLSAADLQSLLLEVVRRRAGRRSPARILQDHSNNRFCPPAALSSAHLHRLEGWALELLAPHWQSVLLSPVCPLGTVSALTDVSQNAVVTTTRRTEVVSDPTNVLALECARRRRLDRAREVGLFTSHRILRAQRFEGPGLLSHFHVFAWCTAGRAEASFGFELRALALQLACLVSLCRQLPRVDTVEISLTPLNERMTPHLERLEIEGATTNLDTSRTQGRDYYRQVCFKLRVGSGDGSTVEVGDGGFTEWTRVLLGDRKERLLTGGLGVDRLAEFL